jgi:hypothetical protein
LRADAVRLLSDWPSLDAAPALLELTRTATGNERALALRGYLRFAASAETPEATRLEMCREAAALVQSDQEKKQLISALGALKSPEARKLLEPWVNDPAVKDEAEKAMAGKR